MPLSLFKFDIKEMADTAFPPGRRLVADGSVAIWRKKPGRKGEGGEVKNSDLDGLKKYF
ncbi:hypothetical protein [Sorlinia euscelidii]|uniref:hypothetical protein n=1 Tax=Sorlinia euscelidii TaxID=3081148 RepID=UPI003AADA08F